MQSEQNGNRRLDSWKEIAAHLGRNERTAIRWEKKGLPVHRVPGGQRQAVFAYTDEIDAWLLSQEIREDKSHIGNELALKESNNDPQLLPSQSPAAQTPKLRFLANRLSLLIAVVLCLS